MVKFQNNGGGEDGAMVFGGGEDATVVLDGVVDIE